MAVVKLGSLAMWALLDVLVVCRLVPSPATLRGLAAPHEWIQRTGTDAAVATVAGALLWLAALWLLLGLLTTAAAAMNSVPCTLRYCDNASNAGRTVIPR